MEIIKGKPIPPRAGRSVKYGFVYFMEYGDCVIVKDDIEKQNISASIRQSDPKCKVVTRSERVNGVREITIWKTEA
jgi:hypothetical protein|tara:strand:- start:1 stop:228 length:228 start_codon:yes stop_codon:yes gene_type:complete